MRTLNSEFPNYDDIINMPDGWHDSSWHNDVSPSFEKQIGEVIFKIWCDYKDPNRREVGGKQFTVATYDQKEFELLAELGEFDTLAEALTFVNEVTA